MAKKAQVIRDYNKEEFEEVVVNIGRITKVVKGGRRFRFNALVVVGNKKGIVGIGTGKAKEVPDAIKKAIDDAFKNLVKIDGIHGNTINHDVQAKYNASKILLGTILTLPNQPHISPMSGYKQITILIKPMSTKP